jgi:hypothetical protein
MELHAAGAGREGYDHGLTHAQVTARLAQLAEATLTPILVTRFASRAVRLQAALDAWASARAQDGPPGSPEHQRYIDACNNLAVLASSGATIPSRETNHLPAG